MGNGGIRARATGERLERLATAAAVAVAAVLVAAKLAAWRASGSVAVLSSLADGSIDLVASTVTFLAVRFAHRPADRSHRFGHGKAEPLGALALAGFVAVSAIFVAVAAVGRLIAPVPIRATELGIIVMTASIALTFGLVALQTRVAEATGSLAIRANRLHYAGDLLTNLAALLALVLVGVTGVLRIDAATGLAIAAYLAVNAVRIGRGSLDELLDREIPSADRARIKAIVAAERGVAGMHDLRTRRSGRTRFIEFQVELDGAMPVRRAHDIVDRVETAVAELYPGAQVIIHQEPTGLVDARLDHRLES
jgi:ferrous-iron efflux pump FieF